MKQIDTSKLSTGYAEPDIAAKQRKIVDWQLEDMHAGKTPSHFAVVGDMLNRIRRWMGPNQVTLLDAGCSSAYYYEVIEHYVPGWVQYMGVDYNPGMVRLARTYYPNLQVLQADLRDLEITDCAFDVVLSGAAIAHIKDWRLALSEIVRVTRHWLLLHRTWVYLEETRPTRRLVTDAYGHDVWYHYINEQELIKTVEDLGMQLMYQCNAGEGPPDGTKEWASRTHLFGRE